MVKRIAVVTGTRAEFGLLQPLLEKIVADPETELQLIVTGMHLSPEFGLTVREIREAGYTIADEVEMLVSSDTGVGTAKSVGLGTIGIADSLRRLQPDWLVLLGDRFEILAAATAAMLMGIPIAHIHGGERTEGAIDESIRHCVTKMARLHFVSTEQYRKRVIQLGESPETVFHVGAIGLDRIDKSKLMTRDELAQDLGIDAARPWCTVTYHPVTTDPESVGRAVAELIAAMKSQRDMCFIITKANADRGGRLVNQLLEEYVTTADNARLFDSLGSKRYLSCVYHSEVVLGNSSSGIIEAPYLGTPSVDVGERQKGRVKDASVITCREDSDEIKSAITAATEPTKTEGLGTSLYFQGGAAAMIAQELKNAVVKRAKPFHDVVFEA